MRPVLAVSLFVFMLGPRLFLLADFYPVLIESDEAVMGLMARHILQGELPLFFWGQHYLGTLEAFVASVYFIFIGSSALVLKISSLTLFCVFLVSHYYLAIEILNRRWPSFLATLLLAVSPAFLTIWSMKARGYLAPLVLGTTALLMGTKIIKDTGISNKKMVLLGLVMGLAVWSNFIAIAFGVAIALGLLVRHRSSLGTIIIFGSVGFFFGLIPVWVYNLQHFAASLTRPMYRQTSLIEDLNNIFTIGMPILFGGRANWKQGGSFFPGSDLLVILIIGAAFLWMVFKLLQFAANKTPFQGQGLENGTEKGERKSEDKKSSDPAIWTMILSFPVIHIAMVCISGAGQFMVSPRYLFALYSVVYLILIAALKKPFLQYGAVSILIGINLFGSFQIKRHEFVINQHDPKEVVQFLRENQLNHSFAPYWIAYRLTFETKEKHISTPPESDYVRRVDYLQSVKNAKRKAYIHLDRKNRDPDLQVPEGLDMKRLGNYVVHFPRE